MLNRSCIYTEQIICKTIAPNVLCIVLYSIQVIIIIRFVLHSILFSMCIFLIFVIHYKYYVFWFYISLCMEYLILFSLSKQSRQTYTPYTYSTASEIIFRLFNKNPNLILYILLMHI